MGDFPTGASEGLLAKKRKGVRKQPRKKRVFFGRQCSREPANAMVQGKCERTESVGEEKKNGHVGGRLRYSFAGVRHGHGTGKKKIGRRRVTVIKGGNDFTDRNRLMKVAAREGKEGEIFGAATWRKRALGLLIDELRRAGGVRSGRIGASGATNRRQH